MRKAATVLKHIFILLLLVAVASCSTKESKRESIRLSGSISNLQQEQFVILKERTNIYKKQNTLIDTIAVDGKGKFYYENDLKPYTYELQVYDQGSILLAIDRGQQLQVDIDNPVGRFSYQISGSSDTELLMAYERFRKSSLERLVYPIRREIKALRKVGDEASNSKIAELGEKEIANYELHKEELIDFIQKEMGTSLGIYETSVRWSGEKNIPYFSQLAGEFKAAHPESDLGSLIESKVQLLKQTSVGGKVSNIVMPDSSGIEHDLYKNLGKLTLIDFWASWCPPCRREAEGLNELYSNYREQGFQIYGVSLDSKEERWKAAMIKDNRRWPNVSTLQRFNTPASYDYAVTALPANFLVDEQGTIVAKDLHNDELDSWVSQFFNTSE